jgi:hypothetical protein
LTLTLIQNPGARLIRPYGDVYFKSAALTLFYTIPGTIKERYTEIEKQTGIYPRSQKEIRRKAKEREFNPKIDEYRIRSEYFIDALKFGRPISAVNSENERQVIEIITKNRNGREKSAEIIGSEVMSAISRQSACRILYKAGFKKIKKSIKPGLNKIQKEKRLRFYRKYQYWNLEDWKNIIWSDETSVIIEIKRNSYKI